MNTCQSAHSISNQDSQQELEEVSRVNVSTTRSNLLSKMSEEEAEQYFQAKKSLIKCKYFHKPNTANIQSPKVTKIITKIKRDAITPHPKNNQANTAAPLQDCTNNKLICRSQKRTEQVVYVNKKPIKVSVEPSSNRNASMLEPSYSTSLSKHDFKLNQTDLHDLTAQSSAGENSKLEILTPVNEEEMLLSDINTLNGLLQQRKTNTNSPNSAQLLINEVNMINITKCQDSIQPQKPQAISKIDISNISPSEEANSPFKKVNNSAIYDRNTKWKGEINKKINEEKDKKENDALKHCTFEPEFVTGAANRKGEYSYISKKPFLKREVDWSKYVEQQIKRQKDFNKGKELDGCTFVPDTSNVLKEKREFLKGEFYNRNVMWHKEVIEKSKKKIAVMFPTETKHTPIINPQKSGTTKYSKAMSAQKEMPKVKKSNIKVVQFNQLYKPQSEQQKKAIKYTSAHLYQPKHKPVKAVPLYESQKELEIEREKERQYLIRAQKSIAVAEECSMFRTRAASLESQSHSQNQKPQLHINTNEKPVGKIIKQKPNTTPNKSINNENPGTIQKLKCKMESIAQIITHISDDNVTTEDPPTLRNYLVQPVKVVSPTKKETKDLYDKIKRVTAKIREIKECNS